MPERQQARDAHDISVRGVGWGAAAIVGGIVFALAVAYGAWRLLPQAQEPDGFAAPPPLLQSAPQPDRAAFFAAKQRRIDSYGWVYRKGGVAHIPVEEAMRLMAARAAQGRAGK